MREIKRGREKERERGRESEIHYYTKGLHERKLWPSVSKNNRLLVLLLILSIIWDEYSEQTKQ